MTSILLLAYISATAILSLVMMVAVRMARRSARTEPPRNRYIKQITLLLNAEQKRQHCIMAHSARRRLALAEAIHTVVSHTYGNDTEPLREVVEQNNLAHFLLRRVQRTRGARRAHMLMLMSTLPLHRISLQEISRYTRSTNADVRISALVLMLAANPTLAIRTIGGLDFLLSPFDIAGIMALLRRGVLPIAYEPLLGSDNRNLRMLGLAIVRAFGIEIAEKRLHHIVVSERRPTIFCEAIYTLASLGRPLHHAGIRQRLDEMSSDERRRLCRHLSVEGYSLNTVRHLFTESESLYAEILINSHKRALARNNTQ